MLAEIRAQYTIGYLSTNDKTDGAWRKVEIKVETPKAGAATSAASARKGYFAPLKVLGPAKSP